MRGDLKERKRSGGMMDPTSKRAIRPLGGGGSDEKEPVGEGDEAGSCSVP